MPKRRRPAGDFWDEDDFIDINSHSSGEPPQRTRPLKETAPRRPQRKPASGTGRPRPPAERPGDRRKAPSSGSRPRSPSRPEPAGRPLRPERAGRPRPDREARPSRRGEAPPDRRPARPPRPRKRRAPMPKALRRLLMLGAMLTMLVLTCVLAISLLFKISEIKVTGDLVYREEDILNLCDYKVGDNLFFISTSDRVKRLKSKLPYIADVDIRRHIPGTLEIHITGTQVACCVFSNGSWLYVSGEGKILEMQSGPLEGVMQIEGIVPQNPQVGGQVQLEDKGVEEAYSVILEKIVELGAWGEFTRLDITDPYNIVLWYQDRVQCQLGNAVELDYKVQFGYKLLQEGHIGPQETGVLDLSYADVRRAGFTSQPVDPSASTSQSSAGGDSSGPYADGGTDSSPENGADDGDDDPDTRGGDIPDTPIS